MQIDEDEIPRLRIAYTAGDRLPSIAIVWEQNLTGVTLTLTLHRPTTLLSRVLDVVDAIAGQAQVNWQDGDLVAGVGQLALIRAADSTGLVQTVARFLLDVEDA